VSVKCTDDRESLFSHIDSSGPEETEKLAEWFGLSEREVNWIRTAKAGNDEDGFSEALLGIDEEGWFPLRVRASEFEVNQVDQVDELERRA